VRRKCRASSLMYHQRRGSPNVAARIACRVLGNRASMVADVRILRHYVRCLRMKARLREPEPDGQLAWAGRGAASVFVRAERPCIEGTERPNEPAQLGTAAAEGRERVLAINTGSNPRREDWRLGSCLATLGRGLQSCSVGPYADVRSSRCVTRSVEQNGANASHIWGSPAAMRRDSIFELGHNWATN